MYLVYCFVAIYDYTWVQWYHFRGCFQNQVVDGRWVFAFFTGLKSHNLPVGFFCGIRVGCVYTVGLCRWALCTCNCIVCVGLSIRLAFPRVCRLHREVWDYCKVRSANVGYWGWKSRGATLRWKMSELVREKPQIEWTDTSRPRTSARR
jgi:hypothetical protein